MIEKRPFNELGGADHGWLKARHHFSFAGYHDPERMGWGALRVWNDDEIAPRNGFPPHPHADMEIITYVRQGAITHQDSLGNKGRTVAGDVQVMSAGTGVTHSEYNLEDELAMIFQVWIIPTRRGGKPDWGTKPFPRENRTDRFVPLASGFKDDTDALVIRADARVLGATITAGETIEYTPEKNRRLYAVAATGKLTINGQAFSARDGAAIRDEKHVRFAALEDTEVVLVDSADG